MIEYLYEYLKNPWNVHTVNTASISLQYNVYLICLDTIFYKEEENYYFSSSCDMFPHVVFTKIL